MRMLTGALLLLTAEQAFAHAHLVGFPHYTYVNEVLVPASLVLAVFGVLFLVWGVIADRTPVRVEVRPTVPDRGPADTAPVAVSHAPEP